MALQLGHEETDGEKDENVYYCRVHDQRNELCSRIVAHLLGRAKEYQENDSDSYYNPRYKVNFKYFDELKRVKREVAHIDIADDVLAAKYEHTYKV